MTAWDRIREVVRAEKIWRVDSGMGRQLSNVTVIDIRVALHEYERVKSELALRVDYADEVRKQALEIHNLKLEKLALTRAMGSIQNSSPGARR